MFRRPEPIVITGAGAVCALGVSCAELWAGIAAGHDGIDVVHRFSTDAFAARLGAIVPGRNQPMPAEAMRDLCLEYALTALREAVDQAALEPQTRRTALVVGTSLGDMVNPIHSIAATIAEAAGVRGPAITVSTACTSSANAIGLGVDLLRQGSVDAVIAGGTDILSDTVFAGFHALGVLSQQKCAPFALPMGTTLGEGAGFLVLESAERAAARGAEVLASIGGYGLSSDAYHETSPDPTGAGIGRAIVASLQHAGITPADVQYVNAHGSGTAANDRAEWQGIQRTFGERALGMPVSSVKSHLGHAQGAAGVLELIVTLLAMRRGLVPPTLHCTPRRPFGPADPVAQDTPRRHDYKNAVCLSSAFGGANAAVVLARGVMPVVPAPTRMVFVLGAGTATAASCDLDRLLRADPRTLDDGARYLTAAGALALRDAGVRVRGTLRDRAGLVVGTTTISARAGAAFRRSVDERGLHRCSTTAFARMVLNAAAGSACAALALRGPTSTLTTGSGSGLIAIIYAVSLLASRNDVDVIVAGGLDALGAREDTDGAACLVFGTDASVATSAERRIEVAGWGLSGPRRPAEALEQALAMAGIPETSIDLLMPNDPAETSAAALPSAQRCARALSALREGRADNAAILTGSAGSAAGAIVLRAT